MKCFNKNYSIVSYQIKEKKSLKTTIYQNKFIKINLNVRITLK